jgi:hypothetical protein
VQSQERFDSGDATAGDDDAMRVGGHVIRVARQQPNDIGTDPQRHCGRLRTTFIRRATS